MPRIFMAVRREPRYPISEILAQTPKIPENCQWGIFLRNHDELTLEMVTDEERDYMYSEYAKDPRMQANIGIRRRLAPAAGERPQPDRAVHRAAAVAARLAGALLRRRDRHGRQHLARRPRRRPHPDAVDPDRNAGFSDCDPGRLYLPVIMDPIYGYQAINVEAQQKNAGSLLHWTRRMIEIRKRHPVFGLGGYAELNSSNPSVLAFVRETGRRPRALREQPVPLPAAGGARPAPVRGVTPVEMHGRSSIPADWRASVSFDASWAWVLLVHPRHRPSPRRSKDVLDELLAAWIGHQRWFAGKGRPIDDSVDRLRRRTRAGDPACAT